MFNELGNEIRHERMFKGLSQTELSKRTGIDVKTIRDITGINLIS